jgi:SAM-dependent methyltransferase
MFTKSARFYDAIYSFKDYAAEAAKIDAIIRTRKPDARTLLDVACGTGLHLEHLRGRYEVVEGLDLDPELLAIARERLPGVPLHEGDMRMFDLGRRFDAVICLFSSIGYARTVEDLNRAVAALANHIEPDGVVVVEPWITPDAWEDDHLGAVFVDEPDLKIARVNLGERDGRLSRFVFHYLVLTSEGVERFEEPHELGLFTHEEYAAAFRAAGLEVEHDPEGLMGRGLYVGRSVAAGTR